MVITKIKEKEKAIRLRKKGFSYNEILRIVPVAKSSLSLWLRSVGLTKKQKQRLTRKKMASIKRGWETRKKQRIILTKKIKKLAHKEIKCINKRDLWMIGVALYWAEGSKEKETNRGQGVAFSNSDPLMIKLFLKWLSEIIKIKKNEIKIEIYVHQSLRNNLSKIIRYWSKITGIKKDRFKYIYLKKNIIRKKRNNQKGYYGLVRICIRKSTNLNRKISGWIESICRHCRVV